MERLEVLKTYKLYIVGKFPRTESGRYYQPGEGWGNICRASRKDYRNAVQAARGAQTSWASRSAYNKGQILYRIAEMLEGRRAQFREELVLMGAKAAEADKEIQMAVDRLVYYAGWTDKYQALFGTVNPVATSHFNFSQAEPMGVVSIVAPEENGLIGLVSVIAPVIASRNTVVVLASESKPLSAITFAEVLAVSDVPGGVVNILTGYASELLGHFASHMDVNAVWYSRDEKEALKSLEEDGAENMKRIISFRQTNSESEAWEDPYLLRSFTEIKTTWHPIEKVGGGGASY